MSCVQDSCSVFKTCILVYSYWAFVVWIDYKSFSVIVFSLFMARLTIVRGSLWFCLVGLSVRSRGSNLFSSKNTYRGFEKVWGVMIFSTRVLVRSTWNLFRSTIYELKLCTSCFLSACAPPSELSEHSLIFCNVLLNLSQGVGRINLKPTWMEYIWLDVVRSPRGAASRRPFSLTGVRT